MAIIAAVKKQGNESTSALLRRFTKRVQGAGALQVVRENRYSKRTLSTLKVKRRALDGIAKRATYQKLAKLGKNIDKKSNGRRR